MGVKNVGIYLVKRVTTKGEVGGLKIKKMGRRRLWMAPPEIQILKGL